MRNCCDTGCETDAAPAVGPMRRVLWVALVLNAAMFVVELVGGVLSGSMALQADALDFLGDAANYGISLYVLGRSIRWRAGAAIIKGSGMGLFGLWVLGMALWRLAGAAPPQAPVMGALALLALAVNVLCAALLFAYRGGDANMRSVWLCSRNDALGNLAVLAAAGGVFATGSALPDLLVAALIATLALSGAWQVLRQARGELRAAGKPATGLAPQE